MSKELVKLAREAINSHFENKKISEEKYKKFNQKKGVFVTLKTLDDELRGCIGRIESDHLGKALVDSALNAAFNDYRFSPLEKNEKFKIEVSILTKPENIDIHEEKDLNKIKIGRDGLIIDFNGNVGLLLPVVAVEYKLDAKGFIEHTCLKAGLDKNAWRDKNCKINKFEVEVFKE